MAKTVTLNPIDPNTFEYQEYSNQDSNLIVNFTIEPTFDPLQNYVTYFVYDLNDSVLFSDEIDFRGYSIINGQVVLNPEIDLEAVGFEEGEYNVVYNFLNNEISSSFSQRLYIDQISSDRTEIRLNTTQIPNLDLINGANSLITQIQSNPGVYFEFFVNFGDNQLVIANNMLLDTSNPEDPTVLIKLYEPLPINFVVKDECWIVTEVANPVAYNINIVQTFEVLDENIFLKGPNLNLGIKDEINNSTEYTTYSTLTSSSYSTGANNLQYQINSILAERGIEINVDYSDYNNFIYFSSALTRLENFYYKLQLIEEYQYSASFANNVVPLPSNVTTNNTIWDAKINEIITTFDGYDYYLYYESSSTAWPKTNSTYPYTNASTANPGIGWNWFVTQSEVAAEFDENNNNSLIDSIPEFLRNDASNAEYELFIEMLGEMFDNIWIYYQDVTNKFNADNRLQYGISKDLVADVLRDLGLKIYQNSFGSADLYTALLGVTPSGSDFPFPYMTGSLPAPTGYEYINASVSASNTVVPLEDIEKGTYKRLYHNLPLLLKKKGTTVGIQDLITTYGIPSTILRVAEFGGKDKDESNDWDYYKQRYNNAYNHAELADWIGSEFRIDNSYWVTQYTTNRPETVLFRFKTPGVDSAGVSPSQSLFTTDQGVLLALQYSGSINASGSWSGSAINPYNEYAYLTFYPDAGDLNTTASVYLPFFNGGWWTTAITVNNNTGGFTLYAANNIYDGDDGSTIGFIASSSVNGNFSVWESSISASLGSRNGTQVSGFEIFSGSFQELRYYTTAISDNSFRDITMNPDSIESTTLNSSPDQLAFRASLGGELYTGSVSIHPKVTGSWVATSSFASNSDFYIGNPNNFVPNIETVYLDQPAAGIKNIVSNKIQIVDMDLPAGNTLSQYRSIQQKGSGSYTENLAYTEVAFSPQNEINDDIMDQLGFFNMGEFIGDPRQRFNQDESYPDLDALRNAYFEKYVSNYDLNDYIRLIKFFDNSLFKMIKDFTPARSSLASGVVVKQHLLERNKYPQPEVTQSLNDLSGSIPMGYIDGGAGGSVNNLNGLDTNPYYVDNVYGVTQSWEENFIIPSGVVTQTHDSQDEFYNGEYSGSEFIVEDGELNSDCDIYKNPSTQDILYNVSGNFNPSFQAFLNQQQLIQGPGEIHIWWEQTIVSQEKEYAPGYFDYVYSPAALTISKISANGVNLEDYIPNALEYILQTAYISGDVTLSSWTPSFFPSYNLGNLDLKVDSIQEVYTSFSGTGYYIVQLLPNSYNITVLTDNPAGTVALADKANVVSVLEPYVPIGFYNSDCNPVINNTIVNRLSEWYQQVDYNTAQTTPVNFAQIISGTAYPAALQDSNYTSYQYSGIRYWGSKNTTDGFNTSSISQSLIVGSYQNDNIGATTLGYPSVDKLDATILQFDWGGGTYPQIINGGILALNDMLLVGVDRDAIGKYSPQQIDYLTAAAQAYPIGSYPIFNQYTTAVTTTVGAQVAEYGWTTPSVSNYYIPSGAFGGAYGAAMVTSSNPNKLYILDVEFLSLNPPGLGSINSQGSEVPVEATGSLNTYKTISSSLAAGESWYVSMYYNLGNIASGTLQPITGSSELSQQGVYKILSIDYPGGLTPLTASLDANVNTNFSASVFGYDSLSPTGTIKYAGLLLWKSIPGNYMRVKNATLSGLGKGGLVTSTPTPVIEQEFTYITQNYGTNPKNQ